MFVSKNHLKLVQKKNKQKIVYELKTKWMNEYDAFPLISFHFIIFVFHNSLIFVTFWRAQKNCNRMSSSNIVFCARCKEQNTLHDDYEDTLYERQKYSHFILVFNLFKLWFFKFLFLCFMVPKSVWFFFLNFKDMTTYVICIFCIAHLLFM